MIIQSRLKLGGFAEFTTPRFIKMRSTETIQKLERERDEARLDNITFTGQIGELTARVAELEKALGTAVGLIVRHHEVGVKQEWGCFCPVCHHKDGSEPELDAIKASLKMPSR